MKLLPQVLHDRLHKELDRALLLAARLLYCPKELNQYFLLDVITAKDLPRPYKVVSDRIFWGPLGGYLYQGSILWVFGDRVWGLLPHTTVSDAAPFVLALAKIGRMAAVTDPSDLRTFSPGFGIKPVPMPHGPIAHEPTAPVPPVEPLDPDMLDALWFRSPDVGPWFRMPAAPIRQYSGIKITDVPPPYSTCEEEVTMESPDLSETGCLSRISEDPSEEKKPRRKHSKKPSVG